MVKEVQVIEAAVTGATKKILENIEGINKVLFDLGKKLNKPLKQANIKTQLLNKTLAEYTTTTGKKTADPALTQKLAEAIDESLKELAKQNEDLKKVSNQFSNAVNKSSTPGSQGP